MKINSFIPKIRSFIKQKRSEVIVATSVLAAGLVYKFTEDSFERSDKVNKKK